MNVILRTQAETDGYLCAHVTIGECVPVTLAPVERIDLSSRLWLKTGRHPLAHWPLSYLGPEGEAAFRRGELFDTCQG